ncbi:Protein CHROMATIN REMODELING 20 [Cladobotryum mycophilum]|uniref:Protein CHROMATIN REMODELING 20 n=1 Tax=Cladobotryum mycophilum TaxID=491253 RepID=A0ABR0SD46_9HYPO
MDGIRPDDPFSWDVEEVSKQLCSPGQPWTRDPSALAQKIQEEEMDGKTLLTYEHVFSRKELMKCLGIKIARQKAALVEEIVGFQARSRGFRSWKKDYSNKLSLDDLADAEPLPSLIDLPVGLFHEDNVERNAFLDLVDEHDQTGTGEADQAIAAAPGENPPTPAESNLFLPLEPSSEEGSGPADPAGLPKDDQAALPLDEAHSAVTSKPDNGERPSKRRRVAPINLSTQPLAQGEFEPFGLSNGDVSMTQDDSDLYSYLGSKSLDMSAVKSHTGSTHSQLTELHGISFSITTPNNLPPGLRLVVGRTMRNLLRNNGRKEALVKAGIVPMRSPSPSDNDDEIIDMDGLPDDWDEETQREIDEEQAENAARDRELARCLSHERVEVLLQEALEEMKAKWEEKKLPRYQRKAYKLWTDARRSERSKRMIFAAQRQAEFYEGRIRKLISEILKDKWQKEQDVRDQARVLEQNLDDKLYQLWLISLLESRIQPAKPNIISRPRDPLKAPTSTLDDEVLTSDDDMDGFIVVDEELPAAVDEQPADSDAYSPCHDSPVPYEPDPDMTFDLTQLESPDQVQNSEAARIVIDLTTPIKRRGTEPPTLGTYRPEDKEKLEDHPPIDQLENVESIGNLTATHWAKNKDRWRLIICMIFKLEHARRQAILGLLQEKSTEEAWDASIQLQLSRPITTDSQLDEADEVRTLAFDLTRVFLSFVRCRQTNNVRVMEMEKKEKNRLRRSKHGLFPPFCTFLKEMTPYFPQDSQILRVETFEDDIGLGELSEEEAAANGRKRVVKEVVQNKEAVDLRERELRRIEEQEVRRMKLRAALANSTFIAHDKSRLIINESKQEDQALIYVNEDIGRRIKDHQINGVRFLWNQIIRDASVRQGCLLAHTMGLGKTMQVITFLVSIIEAATSDDVSVRNQIPEDLRKSQTLVLCPSGLVDNWMDEVLLWAPQGLLGSVRKVESSMSRPHRLSTIRDWAQDGGLIIIGYDMFKRTADSGEDGDDIEDALTNTPNIVIADEAHTLKNPNTKVNQVCAKFRTRSRIALTGTPLSNNVEEYYAMIDWVAPNFLGPPKEFRDIYSHPIQQGLWSDSGPADKREALKMMEVLKRTVAPIVDRATISAIKDDLPSKHEFVLFVAPTPMQKKLYDLYMTAMLENQMPQAKIFSILNDLTLVCNHPRCFQKVAQDIRKNPRDNAESSLSENVLSAVLKETNRQDLDNPELSQKVALLLLILNEARQAKEKVLVFSQSIPTLNYLENLLTQQRRLVCRLDGVTKISKRQEMIKSFNRGNQEVYLISTRAGGVGLNIQGANRVVIFDIRWNPVVDQQAIGRAYRIGQQKTVYVYHLLVAGTFEEVLHNKAVFKMQLASRLVDKKNPVSWGKRFGVLEPVKHVAARDLSPFLNRDRTLDKLIKHNSNGEAIRQILSTDTFEEEDASSRVTPEMNQQIEELMKLESIRRKDPERYGRLQAQKQMAELMPHNTSADARQTPKNWRAATAGTPSVNQSMDGAYDGPSTAMQIPATRWMLPSQAALLPSLQVSSAQVGHMPRLTNFQQIFSQTMASSQHIPTPPPIAGANTYFRDVEPAPPVVHGLPTTPRATSTVLESTPGSKSGSIFSQPRSQAKDDFETKLVGILKGGEGSSISESTELRTQTAQQITMGIAEALKEQSQGFLPDNLRWRLLEKLLDHDRFVAAMTSGVLRSDFLALAKAEEVERRALLLDSLSDEEAKDQLQRMKSPDPSNLSNIGKSSVQSSRAREDLEVMQQAADKRRQRGFRLPPWANEALARNSSEGP